MLIVDHVCQACGFQESAADPFRSWSFFIAWMPSSLNARKINQGVGRWNYKTERDLWILEMRVQRLKLKIPKATGKRRLIATRVYKPEHHARDYVNLVGGMKACVDAMVFEGLIVDDTPKMLEDHYKQRVLSDLFPGPGLVVQLADVREQNA